MPVLAELGVVAPFPWATLLGCLGPRLIPGYEWIVDGGYERRHKGASVWVTYRPKANCLQITADKELARAEIVGHVSRLFDVGQHTQAVDQHLRACPVLRPYVERAPGLRPLGCWSPFELCGELSPAKLRVADLDAIGMPGRRVAALRRLADAAASDVSALASGSWAEIDAALSRLPGIGPWTRAYLAIRLGRRPDVLPESNLGLQRAVGAASPAALRALAQRWRPYRANAAAYLWCAP